MRNAKTGGVTTAIQIFVQKRQELTKIRCGKQLYQTTFVLQSRIRYGLKSGHLRVYRRIPSFLSNSVHQILDGDRSGIRVATPEHDCQELFHQMFTGFAWKIRFLAKVFEINAEPCRECQHKLRSIRARQPQVVMQSSGRLQLRVREQKLVGNEALDGVFQRQPFRLAGRKPRREPELPAAYVDVFLLVDAANG